MNSVGYGYDIAAGATGRICRLFVVVVALVLGQSGYASGTVRSVPTATTQATYHMLHPVVPFTIQPLMTMRIVGNGVNARDR